MLFGFSEHPVTRSWFCFGIWRKHGACSPVEFFVFFRSRVEAGGIRQLCCPQPVERSWFCFGFWRQQGAWIPGPVCGTCMHMRTGLYAYKPLCFRVFRHEPKTLKKYSEKKTFLFQNFGGHPDGLIWHTSPLNGLVCFSRFP